MPITQLQKCRGAKMRPLLRAQRCTNKKVATPPPHTSPLTPHHLDARTVARHKLKMRECQTTFTFTYKMQKELNARPYNWVRGQGQELRAGTVPTGRGRAVCMWGGGAEGFMVFIFGCAHVSNTDSDSDPALPAVPPHTLPRLIVVVVVRSHILLFFMTFDKGAKKHVWQAANPMYTL